MKLLRELDDSRACRGGFVSIGNFDGVHLGHQSMVRELVGCARAAGAPAVVFTFDPHPIAILRPAAAPPRLSTVERKAELLERLGVDCMVVYPTGQELLGLLPRQFFEKIVEQQLEARGLVEGPNFFFGRGRSGDIQTLQSLCEAGGLTLKIVEPVKVGGQIVSSSAIRTLIAGGEIDVAAELLGHPYRIHGLVVRGAERGRTLGFPTANLDDVKTIVPYEGVYAGFAFPNGAAHLAAIHIGPNATFGEGALKIEVHLLDFDEDLYGRRLAVDIHTRIRDTRRFGGVDQLLDQINRDIQAVRALAKVHPSG